jgi:integrase/recombinase XerC
MDNLKIHIKSFLTHIRLEKNYSEGTKKSYDIILSVFLSFLEKNNYSVTTQSSISEYILYLHSKDNCDVTIANRLMVIKSFYNYLIEKKLFSKKSLATIQKYKTTRKLISLPSDKDVSYLLSEMTAEYKKATLEKSISNHRQKSKHYSLLRDLTFFTMMSATGLRISECLNIKVSKINWQDHSVVVTGKGAKERLIFFGTERVTHLINELLILTKKYNIASDFLFVGYRSQDKLTPRCMQATMKLYTEKLSIKQCTPHTLRHYYATRSIEKGANIKAISLLLGHSNIQTTLKMYFHISKKVLKETFESRNPFSEVTATVDEIISNRYQLAVNL